MADLHRIKVELQGTDACIIPLYASFDRIEWVDLNDPLLWGVDPNDPLLWAAATTLDCGPSRYTGTASGIYIFTIQEIWAVGQEWAFFKSGSGQCSVGDKYWNRNSCTVTAYDTNGNVLGSASALAGQNVPGEAIAVVPLDWGGWWTGFRGCAEI